MSSPRIEYRMNGCFDLQAVRIYPDGREVSSPYPFAGSTTTRSTEVYQSYKPPKNTCCYDIEHYQLPDGYYENRKVEEKNEEKEALDLLSGFLLPF